MDSPLSTRNRQKRSGWKRPIADIHDALSQRQKGLSSLAKPCSIEDMEKQTRLLRVVRWVPYVVAVLLAIALLIYQLTHYFEPFEGAIPFLYERLFEVFLLLLLIGSVFAWGAVRSVLALISCTAIACTLFKELLINLRQIAIHTPPGGSGGSGIIPWRLIAVFGLLLTVMVIEAATLIRSRTDKT
jgi:hypothetical protein